MVLAVLWWIFFDGSCLTLYVEKRPTGDCYFASEIHCPTSGPCDALTYPIPLPPCQNGGPGGPIDPEG